MDILEFFNGREIFITGATGFLGKSLFEKLLRSFPNIPKIYILIRSKRGKTAMERLEDFKNELVFERINRECPKAFEKVIPIIGDCQDIGLGISDADLKLLENVSVIFHEAAFVKFDNDLKGSLLMNTRGTYELVKIALTLKHLISFVHVSTAYICPEKTNIEEKLYDPPINWRNAIKIAETYDRNTLEIYKNHFTEFSPTVYTFSKNLSEHIINEFSDRLPMAIIRPSIVSHSSHEPEPGFLDNLNGPMGLLVTVGTGIGQITCADPNVNLSLFPVDFVSSLTITMAYKRGLEKLNSPMEIYNLAPRELFVQSSRQCALKFLALIEKNPLQYTVWAPRPYLTSNFLLYITFVILIQVPACLIFDTLLKLFKKEAVLVKTIRRIVYTVKALGKFARKCYNINNDGMWKLFEIMRENDKSHVFDNIDPRNLDYDALFRGLLLGIKKHIFKEPIEATPATKRRYKILKYINGSIEFILFIIVLKYLWNLVN